MSNVEFVQLKEMLDSFDIPYKEGKFYSDNGIIIGQWLIISECEFDTDEITTEDEEYNNHQEKGISKMRRIDYLIVFICALAAALCGFGLEIAAPVFCISSTIGLIDSMKNKVLSAALINGIFLVLNLFNTIKIFI